LSQFKQIYVLNFVIAFIFFFGFFVVIDPLIIILFEEASVLPRDIVLIITINYFVQFMRQATLTFKDASGLFYQDRFKPLVEGIVNLILSLILVYILGIQGVLIATIFTNLFITHTVEPFVLYRYGFESKVKNYYLINYGLMAFFTAFLVGIYYIPLPSFNNHFIDILVLGSGAVLISILFFGIVCLFSKNARQYVVNWYTSVIV